MFFGLRNKHLPEMDFNELTLHANVIVFICAASATWLGGTKLSEVVNAISNRSNIGQAFAGMLLLGGATSLPEIATSVTAAVIDNPELAASNLMGGVAMQTAMLALCDMSFRSASLTYLCPKPVLIMGGVLLIIQLALALLAMTAGEFAVIGHVGVWSIVLLVAYSISLSIVARYEDSERWLPGDLAGDGSDTNHVGPPSKEQRVQGSNFDAYRISRLYLIFFVLCLLVLASGCAVSLSAGAIAIQTNLTGGFVGATLVALATSLPELSTTFGAVRIGCYTLAVANIFGTNTLEVALLSLADFFYISGSIIEGASRSALFMAALGIILTAVYLWGLLERRNNTVLNVGVDSWIVICGYLLSILILFQTIG